MSPGRDELTNLRHLVAVEDAAEGWRGSVAARSDSVRIITPRVVMRAHVEAISVSESGNSRSNDRRGCNAVACQHLVEPAR